MDPVDSLTKLIEVLRRQRASGPDRLRRSAGKRRAENGATAPSASKPTLEQLEHRIIERLRGLDPEENRKRAARTFLEAVLTWEFGEELIQDPRFSEMVQEVESQMRSDPDLSTRLDKLLEQMMKN